MRWGGVALTLVVLASWVMRLPRGAGADAQNLDVNLYFYPLYEATYGRIAAGVLPTWNPWQLCGIPWLATLQTGVFYPPHVLYLVLPLHVALAGSHALHLALATLSMTAFARRAGLSPAAALLAALLFTLRGMLAMSLAAPAYLEAAAWLPLGALATLEVATDRLGRGAALLATATAMSFLAGYPQPTAYMLGVWTTLAIVAAPARRRLAVWGAFAGALALGIIAAGIQLAPAIELVRDGAHRALSREAMAPFGLSPAEAILRSSAIAGTGFSWGVTALALAATAVLARRRRALAWWAIAVAATSVVLALGDRTPLFPLYRAVPLLGSFRFPDRLLGVADFAVAIAAAIGLDAVTRDGPRGRIPSVVALVAAVAVGALARWGGAPAAEQARTALVAGGVALVLAAHRASAGRHPRLVATALVAAAAAEVLLAPWKHLVTYTPRTLARYEAHASAYRAIASRAGADRVWFWSGVGSLLPEHALKLATRYGVRAIDDYEPLAPRRQSAYFTWFSEGGLEFHRPPWLFAGDLGTLVPPAGVAPPADRRRLLDLAAMRFMVVPTGLRARAELDGFVRDAGLETRPSPDAALTVFENPHVLPRAMVVYRTRPAPGTAALLATLSRPAFDPLAESWVEGATEATDGPRGEPARIAADGERAVEVDATLAQPGLVVLADAFYPGWRATVDGAPAGIVPVNHLFRGVRATTGTHRIRFEYRPASVAWGAIASVIGWLVIAALAVRVFRRRPGARTA